MMRGTCSPDGVYRQPCLYVTLTVLVLSLCVIMGVTVYSAVPSTRTESVQVSNFTVAGGPRGSQGVQGPAGPKGLAGDRGPSGLLDAGSGSLELTYVSTSANLLVGTRAGTPGASVHVKSVQSAVSPITSAVLVAGDEFTATGNSQNYIKTRLSIAVITPGPYTGLKVYGVQVAGDGISVSGGEPGAVSLSVGVDVKGTTSVATSQYGLRVSQPSGGSVNQGIYSDSLSIGNPDVDLQPGSLYVESNLTVASPSSGTAFIGLQTGSDLKWSISRPANSDNLEIKRAGGETSLAFFQSGGQRFSGPTTFPDGITLLNSTGYSAPLTFFEAGVFNTNLTGPCTMPFASRYARIGPVVYFTIEGTTCSSSVAAPLTASDLLPPHLRPVVNITALIPVTPSSRFTGIIRSVTTGQVSFMIGRPDSPANFPNYGTVGFYTTTVSWIVGF